MKQIYKKTITRKLFYYKHKQIYHRHYSFSTYTYSEPTADSFETIYDIFEMQEIYNSWYTNHPMWLYQVGDDFDDIAYRIRGVKAGTYVVEGGYWDNYCDGLVTDKNFNRFEFSTEYKPCSLTLGSIIDCLPAEQTIEYLKDNGIGNGVLDAIVAKSIIK